MLSASITAMRAVLLSLAVATAAALSADDAPFFVHLALSSDPTRMFVSWRTNSSTSPATVAWGSTPGALTSTAPATSWLFTDGGRPYYFYQATMTGLAPGSKVYYAPAQAGGAPRSFTATRSAAQFSEAAPLKIAWLGDLGYVNGQALDYLLKDAAKGTFDHYIHVGDYVRNFLRSTLSPSPLHLTRTPLPSISAGIRPPEPEWPHW